MPSYGLGTTEQEAFDFDLPSGNTCQMKHADLVSLIAAGAVDSIDQLTAMVQTEHVDRVKKGKKTRHLSPQGAPALVPGAEALGPLPPEARQALELMKDKKRWSKIEELVDAVVVQCVLQPKVLPTPVGARHVVDGTVYVDQVSAIDKFAIFSEAMRPIMVGQAAMAPFRAEPAAPVAGVGHDEDVRQPAEPSAGDS
jgi:hypothetical protein